METLTSRAIESVQKSELAYCKFITANDAGDTGGHQSGYHIHKESWRILFDTPGEKGINKERFVTIKWQNEFETTSRFIYYGVGTRNEYRLTRFGKGFPFLSPDSIGDVLTLSKKSEDYYEAFVLHTEEEMDGFFNAFGISPTEANRIIDKEIAFEPEEQLLACFSAFIKSVKIDFPSTKELSENARNCYINSFKIAEKAILSSPDRELLNWIEHEYQLFKAFENDRYGQRIKIPFKTVEELVDFSNTILNRRKSRAGKSLEHHLGRMFDLFKVRYSIQETTEGNKKPDFLFPGAHAYHDPNFNSNKLVFLASKTTCKDRWRQILNEADRIKEKHLFTLQQGISSNQLAEMYEYGVRLVVPKAYVASFPEAFRDRILTLEGFLSYLGSTL